MSKNTTRKGLAFGAGLALVASGLGAVPASAAAGDLVTLAPSTGVNYGTFISDAFTLKTSISSQVSPGALAIKIDNPDQDRLLIKLDGTNPGSEVDLYGISSTGVQEFINSGDNFDIGTSLDDGRFVVDFVAADIVSLVITEIDLGAPGGDDSADLSERVLAVAIQPVGAVTDNSAGAAVTFANGAVEAFDMAASDTAADLAYGAGDSSVSVTSWVESEAVADYETVDAAYASTTETITWYDPKGVVVVPRLERAITSSVTKLNDGTDDLIGSIEFNKPINLVQFDASNWVAEVTTGSTLPSLSTNTALTGTELVPAGLLNADNVGRYLFDTGAAVAASTTFTLSVHSNLAESASVTRWFSSTGYSISAGTTTANSQAVPGITDTVDVDFTQVAASAGNDNFATASIRAGVKSVTYTSQLQVSGVATKTVSIPMLAVVQSGSFLPTGSSFTVAGNASAITKASEARIVTGFTNADGKFSVTVNSAVAAKNESYTVDFYILVNGTYVKTVPERGTGGTAGGTDTSRITATYAAADASATSLTAVNSVVAGESVVVEFTVTDQFGEPISKTAAGKQLYISLVAPSTANLEESAEVPASGEVSFTFANYLTTGGSDLLTATLYTGSAADPTSVDTAVVTLYNTGATGAVQAPETLVGVVTYRDFIADGAKVVTGVTVDPDQDIAYTGTVVDANGVGIPAAVVTISAPGMQIQDGDRYYVGTRTTTANSAGVFSVNLNAHTVNTTGTTVTVTTADGKTASTLVKTYFPEDTDTVTGGTQTLSAKNLVLSVDMPATVIMNQTYAVKAKLTDKWGNPIKTSVDSAVHFLGTGSIQVNGLSTEVERQFDANGEALVYVRSVKDIAGPGTLDVMLQTDGEYTYWDAAAGATADQDMSITEITTDDLTTVWDETVFANSFSATVEVYETAQDAPAADQKVNAGSFKGYVALYAKGYEGSKMSAIVAGKWLVVNSLASDFERVVRYTGAGYDIVTTIYIDGVKIETFNLTTK